MTSIKIWWVLRVKIVRALNLAILNANKLNVLFINNLDEMRGGIFKKIAKKLSSRLQKNNETKQRRFLAKRR
jgi:hypothetical protein